MTVTALAGKRHTQGVKARRKSKQLLDSILNYVYGEAQSAADTFERDAYSLALAVIGAARRESKNPFTEACFSVFGCRIEKHIERRNEWRNLVYGEFRDVSSQRAAAAIASAAESARRDHQGAPAGAWPVPARDVTIDGTPITASDHPNGKWRQGHHGADVDANGEGAAGEAGRLA